MKKFITSIVLLFLICCCMSLHYRQTLSSEDYHSEGFFDNFQLATNLYEKFFMTPSELGIDKIIPSDVLVEIRDKNGNVVESYTIPAKEEEIIVEDISLADDLKRNLANADLIITAIPQGEFTLFHQTIQQPLYVTQVIKGDESLTNSTILLQEVTQRVLLKRQVFGGCTNFMVEDKEYLVFLKQVDSDLCEVKNLYYEITPISYFRLDDVTNVLADEGTKFSEVMNNEFFPYDAFASEKILELKQEILDTYLK